MGIRRIKIIISLFFILTFVFIIRENGLALEESQQSQDEIKIIEYKAEDLRDPFKKEEPEVQKLEEPLIEVSQPLTGFIVTGIVWGNIPQAIINEKIVKIGDTIDEARVVNIDKYGVTLFFENREYTLPSPASITKDIKKSEQGG